MQRMSSVAASDESGRTSQRNDVARQVAEAVRQVDHDVISGLAVPLGVLDVLRDHPGLDDDDRHLVDSAIARLTDLQAEIRALHDQILWLVTVPADSAGARG